MISQIPPSLPIRSRELHRPRSWTESPWRKKPKEVSLPRTYYDDSLNTFGRGSSKAEHLKQKDPQHTTPNHTQPNQTHQSPKQVTS